MIDLIKSYLTEPVFIYDAILVFAILGYAYYMALSDWPQGRRR